MPATTTINAKRLPGLWPNMFIFPTQLREMIPHHGPRALVVDEVTGTPNYRLEPGDNPRATRAVVEFAVHETGKLDGSVPVYLDLDGPTLRALGQFLLDLSQQLDDPVEQ